MGLFDELKTMKEIIGGGIAAAKAGDALDDLFDRSIVQYEDLLSDQEKTLLAKAKDLREAYDQALDDNDNDDEEDFTALEQWEIARSLFLTALLGNDSIPQDFKDEVKTKLEEFKVADNFADEFVEKALINMAETDEERDYIKQVMAESLERE